MIERVQSVRSLPDRCKQRWDRFVVDRGGADAGGRSFSPHFSVPQISSGTVVSQRKLTLTSALERNQQTAQPAIQSLQSSTRMAQWQQLQLLFSACLSLYKPGAIRESLAKRTMRLQLASCLGTLSKKPVRQTSSMQKIWK